MAIAACSDLKSLHADYNNLTDVCGILLVSLLASNPNLEYIDLEGTGLTDKSVQVFKKKQNKKHFF